MCGIVGYIGEEQAGPVLLDGLAKLEYRGYDSAGIAVSFQDKEGNNQIEVVKANGRLQILREMTDDGKSVPGFCGIGHTRWATHGEPSVINAHPHCEKNKSITIVHNGIIENYQELAEGLLRKGYQFVSQTDTEVVVHLLDSFYEGDPLDAITKVMVRVHGSYALGILFKDRPGEIYAVRKDSPLIVGTSEGGNFIASDVPAILKRKVKEENYAVLRETAIPSVLIEVGFLTNKEERGKLLSPEYQEILAEAIASGILNYDDTF